MRISDLQVEDLSRFQVKELQYMNDVDLSMVDGDNIDLRVLDVVRSLEVESHEDLNLITEDLERLSLAYDIRLRNLFLPNLVEVELWDDASTVSIIELDAPKLEKIDMDYEPEHLEQYLLDFTEQFPSFVHLSASNTIFLNVRLHPKEGMFEHSTMLERVYNVQLVELSEYAMQFCEKLPNLTKLELVDFNDEEYEWMYLRLPSVTHIAMTVAEDFSLRNKDTSQLEFIEVYNGGFDLLGDDGRNISDLSNLRTLIFENENIFDLRNLVAPRLEVLHVNKCIIGNEIAKRLKVFKCSGYKGEIADLDLRWIEKLTLHHYNSSMCCNKNGNKVHYDNLVYLDLMHSTGDIRHLIAPKLERLTVKLHNALELHNMSLNVLKHLSIFATTDATRRISKCYLPELTNLKLCNALSQVLHNGECMIDAPLLEFLSVSDEKSFDLTCFGKLLRINLCEGEDYEFIKPLSLSMRWGDRTVVFDFIQRGKRVRN